MYDGPEHLSLRAAVADDAAKEKEEEEEEDRGIMAMPVVGSAV